MYYSGVYMKSFGGQKGGSSEHPRTPPAYGPEYYCVTLGTSLYMLLFTSIIVSCPPLIQGKGVTTEWLLCLHHIHIACLCCSYFLVVLTWATWEVMYKPAWTGLWSIWIKIEKISTGYPWDWFKSPFPWVSHGTDLSHHNPWDTHGNVLSHYSWLKLPWNTIPSYFSWDHFKSSDPRVSPCHRTSPE